MTRVHNFSAGPATLPLEVIEKAQSELTDYKGTGRSIMELSHRSAQYEEIDQQAKIEEWDWVTNLKSCSCRAAQAASS